MTRNCYHWTNRLYYHMMNERKIALQLTMHVGCLSGLSNPGYHQIHALYEADLIGCSWWRHQMETHSALLALCAGNSPVTGEFPAQRPVTRNFDGSFICAWINDWANNREAGDFRRHRAHYDVTVMFWAYFTDDSWAHNQIIRILSKYRSPLRCNVKS